MESFLILIREIPDAKESGLSHLCEFIEDCEFTYLSTQILHLLGKEGPTAIDPSKYIRYIYNRVILENATVRASAVSALAKFGQEVPALRPRIIVLLRRCLHDNDDEVRDRATLYLNVLDESKENDHVADSATVFGHVRYPLANLENSLKEYSAGSQEEPFDISTVSMVRPELPLAEKKKSKKEPPAKKSKKDEPSKKKKAEPESSDDDDSDDDDSDDDEEVCVVFRQVCDHQKCNLHY